MSETAKAKALSFERQRELLDMKIEGLQQRKLYGRVTLDMCAGNIVQARIEESWKLKEEADGIPGEETRTHGSEAEEASAFP